MAISRMQQPRQMYQEGGIMPRLNQLGSGVSSAEQMLQGINQRLESAESSLGEGDATYELAGGMTTTQPPLNLAQNPMKDLFQQPLQHSSGLYQFGPGRALTPGQSNVDGSISPMQSPMSAAMRSMAAGGGMMGRQNYGLGSLVKSIGKGVKSAVSGVKDLVKSDAGKMLGLAALGFGIPGTQFGGLFGRAGFGGAAKGLLGFEGIGPALSGGIDKLGLGVAKGEKPTLGQFGKVFAIGSLGGAALEALTASGADEEELGNIRDVETLKSYLRRGYEQLNPGAKPEQIEEFVTTNTREYAANGGRIGFANGNSGEFLTMEEAEKRNPAMFVDTTTSEYGDAGRGRPTFESALKEEIESVVRIMMGPGSAGIGEPEDGTMKGYQFFRKQYLPKKIKELSENFGYSEDEIYKMLNLKVREFKESPELLQKPKMAMGGRIGYAFGNDPEQNAVEASGIMNLPLNQNPAGATELDLRETGGFIPPVGVKEKEDDIPAMLSNNEFVFTADAVRGMGDGDVNKGAQRMYDMMKKLEGGGRV